MTKDKLIELLKQYQALKDHEIAHKMADDALIRYINDPDIKEEYDAIGKWYA